MPYQYAGDPGPLASPGDVDIGMVSVPRISQPTSLLQRIFSVDPDMDDADRRRSLLAKAALAAGPGFIGRLGRALLLTQNAELQRRGDEDERRRRAESEQLEQDYRRAQIGRLMQPDELELPASAREYMWRQSLPQDERAAYDSFRNPVPYNYTPQGIAAAGQRQAAIAQARASQRAPAARTAPPRYIRRKDGSIMKWVP